MQDILEKLFISIVGSLKMRKCRWEEKEKTRGCGMCRAYARQQPVGLARDKIYTVLKATAQHMPRMCENSATFCPTSTYGQGEFDLRFTRCSLALDCVSVLQGLQGSAEQAIRLYSGRPFRMWRSSEHSRWKLEDGC